MKLSYVVIRGYLLTLLVFSLLSRDFMFSVRSSDFVFLIKKKNKILWVKKMWDVRTTDYYLAIKKSEILPSAPTQMELENTMLSEILCDITLCGT